MSTPKRYKQGVIQWMIVMLYLQYSPSVDVAHAYACFGRHTLRRARAVRRRRIGVTSHWHETGKRQSDPTLT